MELKNIAILGVCLPIHSHHMAPPFKLLYNGQN